jgi:hypothetical protein
MDWNWGITIYDGLNIDSSLNRSFINQVFPSFGNLRNCEMLFEAVNGQAASYPEDENLNSRSASLYETDRNAKRDFLKSSQKENNAAAGI